MKKSIPLNFTIPDLEKPLREKRVTATIRGIGFIKRFGFKPGDYIEVKYKRKRVGFAFITMIRNIDYKELFDPKLVEKEGFNSPEELLKVLSRLPWRYHWENIVDGKMKMPLIEFEWIKDKVK